MSECRKQIEKIADYIDGDLDPELCRQIEEHLAGCQNCRIMVDSLRQTVVLCKDGTCEDLPPEISQRLNEAIKRRWEKKFGKPSK